MTGKLTLSVRDDIHNQNAEGIEFDLWRINNNQDNRVFVKHDRVSSNRTQLLIEPNNVEDLGSFEIILYVKDYFHRFNENIQVDQSRFIIPFGVNDLNQNYHLSIHVKPDGFSCTL